MITIKIMQNVILVGKNYDGNQILLGYNSQLPSKNMLAIRKTMC